MRRSFDESLIIGQVGENTVEAMLRARGFSVERNCDGAVRDGRGPALQLQDGGSIPRPDFTLSAHGVSVGAEIKGKSAITRGLVTKTDETGIDHQKVIDYRDYELQTGIPVFVLFAMYNKRLADRIVADPAVQRQAAAGRVLRAEYADSVYGQWLRNLTPSSLSPQPCHGTLVDYFALGQFTSFWNCVGMLHHHMEANARTIVGGGL